MTYMIPPVVAAASLLIRTFLVPQGDEPSREAGGESKPVCPKARSDRTNLSRRFTALRGLLTSSSQSDRTCPTRRRRYRDLQLPAGIRKASSHFEPN